MGFKHVDFQKSDIDRSYGCTRNLTDHASIDPCFFRLCSIDDTKPDQCSVSTRRAGSDAFGRPDDDVGWHQRKPRRLLLDEHGRIAGFGQFLCHSASEVLGRSSAIRMDAIIALVERACFGIESSAGAVAPGQKSHFIGNRRSP